MARNGVWIAEIERFGYTLRTVGRTKAEAHDAIMEVYDNTFKELNGTSSSVEIEDGCERTYKEVAEDELYVHFCEYGIVNWE